MKAKEVHEYEPCYKLGAFGSRVATLALRGLPEWAIEQGEAPVGEQLRHGIDYIGTFNYSRGSIEVKTDMVAAVRGNIALETHDEFPNGRREDRWMFTSTATFLVVFVTRQGDLVSVRDGGEKTCEGTLYAFLFQKLREEFGAWREAYPPKFAQNPGKRTWIVPVPIRVITNPKAGALLATYSVSYGNAGGVLVATAKQPLPPRTLFNWREP